MDASTDPAPDPCPGLRAVALDNVLRFLESLRPAGCALPARPARWDLLVESCRVCLVDRRAPAERRARFYDEIDLNLARGIALPEELDAAMKSLLRERADGASGCPPGSRAP